LQLVGKFPALSVTFSLLKIKAVRFSERWVTFYQTALLYIPSYTMYRIGFLVDTAVCVHFIDVCCDAV